MLMLLAMAIGVAAVIVLTAVGEGARRYVTEQFSSLGTHLLIVIPGRAETAGSTPAALLGETPRPLTIRDTAAFRRHSGIRRIAPVIVGEVSVSWKSRQRQAAVIGTTAEFIDIRRWNVARGRFLPPGDPERLSPVCVIGSRIRQELFGPHLPLGKMVTIGDRRFRVIGVLGSKGRSIGVDTEEVVIIPVASAQMLFNTDTLFRVIVEARSRNRIPGVKTHILDVTRKRHQGKEDVTVITQDAVLSTFDKILHSLTLTVGGIAAISLAVAGILVMNVMLISVTQRTTEIGLLKALGALRRQIMAMMLTEAAILSTAGALLGIAAGEAGTAIIEVIYPDLPVTAPLWSVAAAFGVALATGLVFGVLPARRAAMLDPVDALKGH